MANNLTKPSDWEADSTVDDEINAAISRVHDYFWEYQEAEDNDEGDYPESPSGYLYDGCEVCQGREYASALFPVIAQATQEGRIWRSSTAEVVAVALLGEDQHDRPPTDSSSDSSTNTATIIKPNFGNHS